MQLYIFSLHERALAAAKTLVKAEAELIDILQKLDSTKGYLQLGHSSLFDYASRGLKLSESTAYSLISIARKSKQIPELKEQIRSGELTLSNARRIVPIINNNNKTEWIEKAKALPQRKLEEELARVFPKIETPEKMMFVNASRVNLSLGISKELMGKLKRVQDLECQRTQTHVNLEDCLEKLVAFYLAKNDPLEKAQQIEQRRQQPEESYEVLQKAKQKEQQERLSKEEPSVAVPPVLKEKNVVVTSTLVKQAKNPAEKSLAATESNKTNSFLRPVHERAPISSALKHHIWYRDQGQCTHRDTKGIRCESRRYLQIHHVKPVEYSGTNAPENLAVLCFAHHQMIHAY